MSRKAKGAHKVWRDRTSEGRESFWEIRDGTFRQSTGTADSQIAEEKLAEYIRQKYRPSGPVSSQEFCLRRLGEEHFLTKRELSLMAKNAQVTKRSVWWDWAAGPLRELRLMGLVGAMDDIPGTKRKKFFLTELGKTKLKEIS